MRLRWATLARATVVALLAVTTIATALVGSGPARGASLLPWLVALAGLGITLLVYLVLRTALRRERSALNSVRKNVAERDRAEERFRDAFETSPIGMAMMDLHGGFVKVNRAFPRSPAISPRHSSRRAC